MPNAQGIIEQRESKLKAELAVLKQERKEYDRALKKSKKWVSVKKRFPDRLPEQGAIRVIVWNNNQMECSWFDKETKEFSRYNGTWMTGSPKDKLENVTAWMQSDWMGKDFYIPPCGPGLKNRILYIWSRISNRASDMAYDIRPKSWSRGSAQLDKKVTFYRDSSGKLTAGLPENIPAPRGYEKIVCNNVFEAERYSELQRRQERVDHQRQQAERGAIEGEFQREIRSEMYNKMVNARNNTNREFMRRALERNANRTDPTAYERESYLHAEAFEQGR